MYRNKYMCNKKFLSQANLFYLCISKAARELWMMLLKATILLLISCLQYPWKFIVESGCPPLHQFCPHSVWSHFCLRDFDWWPWFLSSWCLGLALNLCCRLNSSSAGAWVFRWSYRLGWCYLLRFCVRSPLLGRFCYSGWKNYEIFSFKCIYIGWRIKTWVNFFYVFVTLIRFRKSIGKNSQKKSFY